MAKYVILVNWTEQGVANARDTVSRTEKARDLAKQHGSDFDLFLWTLGRHDVIAVLDAPDDETAAAIAMAVSGQGAIRTETLRAFTADEVGSIVGKLS